MNEGQLLLVEVTETLKEQLQRVRDAPWPGQGEEDRMELRRDGRSLNDISRTLLVS